MDQEQVIISLTRLEEQTKAVSDKLDEHRKEETINHKRILSLFEKQEDRITSLEHSRTKIKTVIGLIVTGLLFVGWEAGAEWVNHLTK